MWLRESWQKAALRFSKPCCLSSILKCLICMQSATVWKISSVNCLQSASKSQGHRKEFDHMATTIICQLLWTAFELSYGWWPWRSVCAHHLHMRTHTNLQKPLWFSEYRFLVYGFWTPKYIQGPYAPQSSWHPSQVLMFETGFPISKREPSCLHQRVSLSRLNSF